MNNISGEFRWKIKGFIAILAVTLFLQTSCSYKKIESQPDSISQKICENVVISTDLNGISQVNLPIYTATIGESDEQYIKAFFNDEKNIKKTEIEDGTEILKTPRDKLSVHPAIAMEYYSIKMGASNSRVFDSYSLLFSAFGSMYNETQIRPVGAHYDYLPNEFVSVEDLPFQTVSDAKRESDKRMRQFEGYTETAYRTETVTKDLLYNIYKKFDLEKIALGDGIKINDEWFETAGGYRFFYSMNIKGYPIYRDSQILKVRTTSTGNTVICPSAEMFVTEDGLIYAYMKSPIGNFREKGENIESISPSVACQSIRNYFEDSIVDAENSVDIYKIQVEYAACRENENVELWPVYAFYYTQGGDAGCLLINAENGKIL